MPDQPVNFNSDRKTQIMSESPLNKLSPVILLLAAIIIGIEVVFQLANYGIIGGPRGVGWRSSAVDQYGYSAAIFDRVWLRGDYSFETLRRFVTYPFINWELTQTAFCAALTLALGKYTTEYYGSVKVVFLYFATAIIGAVVFGALVTNNFPLLGGFAPVYGLIGAYTYALWLRLGDAGENQLMAFRLSGFLLALQLGFGLLFGTNMGWIAELSAFFAGFAMSVLLAPGGWASFLARMRRRA